MSDILIYMAVISVIVMVIAWRAKTDVRMMRNRRNLPVADTSALSDSELSDSEQSTRMLIGDEAYDRMVARVDKILKRHASDRSLNVGLTSGPTTPAGWKELTSLLPGNPLWLRRSDKGEVKCVEVFSGGYKIGELMLEDARIVSNVLDDNVVTGSYVAEQNSYGDSDVVSMRVILFFRPEHRLEGIETVLDADASYRVEIPGTGRLFNISQN